MVNLTFRQKAIDWLNSRRRDFGEGIQLMELTAFRPSVIAKLKRHGVSGPEANSRLTHIVRLYIQVCSGSKDTEVDIDTGLNAAMENQEQVPDRTTLKIAEAAHLIEEGKLQVPETVADIISRYADAYKRRDVLHKQMAELPEDNTEETMAKRKELAAELELLSATMEELFPKYKAYMEEGKEPEPSENGDESSKDDENSTEDDTAAVSLEGKSKEELQKLRKNVVSKISKAKNMLQYQQGRKADVPNPMPECPKRVKYETKIQKLEKQLETIEYAIARC